MRKSKTEEYNPQCSWNILGYENSTVGTIKQSKILSVYWHN